MNLKLIAFVFILPITNAFGCPDLSGSYTCNVKTEDGKNPIETITITQQVQNNTTTYLINGSERIVDGQNHTTPIMGLSDVQYSGTCDESLMLLLDAKIQNAEGRILGDFHSYLVMYKMEKYLRFFEIGSHATENEYISFSRESVCEPTK